VSKKEVVDDSCVIYSCDILALLAISVQIRAENGTVFVYGHTSRAKISWQKVEVEQQQPF